MASKRDPNRGVFVVLEGLSGVGKSTAAEQVAAKLGLHYIDPFAGEFKEARRILDPDPEMLDARFALFFAAILHAGTKVENLLASGESVIVDSWIYRTVATHHSMGSKLNLKAPTWLPEPDVKILLTCDAAIREERIKRRGVPSEYWKLKCEEVSDSILDWYRKNIKKVIEIDVTYSPSAGAGGDSTEAREISLNRMVGDIISRVRPVIKKMADARTVPTAAVERFFLQVDLDDLDRLIEFTKNLIKEAKDLGQESTEQSSESWHDNYNFEESQRTLRMHQNSLGGLSNAREKAVVVNTSESPPVVEVGSEVTLRVIGSERTYVMLVGSYMVGSQMREKGFVSYDAAALKGLLGQTVGHSQSLKIGHESVEVEIVSIRRSPNLDS